MTFTVPSLELWVPGVTSFLHKQSQDSLPPFAHPELCNGGNRSFSQGPDLSNLPPEVTKGSVAGPREMAS